MDPAYPSDPAHFRGKRILAEYEPLSKADKGALRRREGLYSSLLTEWRRQRDQGAEEALGLTNQTYLKQAMAAVPGSANL